MEGVDSSRRIVRALQKLLGLARKRVEHPGLQVVGVLCSGPLTLHFIELWYERQGLMAGLSCT